MTRTAYKRQHIREHYDRINLCVPKGEKAKIRAVVETMQISINEYLFRLVCADLSGERAIYQSRVTNLRRNIEKCLISGKWR